MLNMSGLPCINCKRAMAPDTAKLFAQVLVCEECFRIAETLLLRGERELKQLMVVLKEAIRSEMLRGELQFSSIQQVADVPKVDLMTHLADLAERIRAQKENTCQPSSPTPSSSPSSNRLPTLSEGTMSPRARSVTEPAK